MKFKQYMNEATRLQIGDYVYQKGSDYESFGIVIAQLKNGSFKAKVFTSYNGSIAGKAKQVSLKNWYPPASPIKQKDVPPKILKKLS